MAYAHTHSNSSEGKQDTPVVKTALKPKKAKEAFLTIREVADEMNVQQHVLRFWETKFSQVKPLKRGGGRRYYRPADVVLLKNIQYLLHEQGYTIKGVQKLLQTKGKKELSSALLSGQAQVAVDAAEEATVPVDSVAADAFSEEEPLRALLDELKALREFIATR